MCVFVCKVATLNDDDDNDKELKENAGQTDGRQADICYSFESVWLVVCLFPFMALQLGKLEKRTLS